MLQRGQVIVSPRGTRIEILDNTPERISIRREHVPLSGGTQAKSHRHTAGYETFELITGEATAWLDGRERRLGPGDVLEVPLGTVHVNPYTTAGKTATLVHTVTPRPRAVEVYFTSWLDWLAQGKADINEEPTLWQLGVIVNEAGFAGTWASGLPVILQRVVLPLVGLIAWVRGTRAAKLPREPGAKRRGARIAR